MRFFFLLILLVYYQSWARCQTYGGYGQLACYQSDPECSCSDGFLAYNSYWSDCSWIQGTYGKSCYCHVACDSRCDLVEHQCNQQGFFYDSDKCECVDVCGSPRAKCEGAGGRFTGRALTVDGEQCCSAICDMCNTEANEKIIALKAKYCCKSGFAPPAEGENCYSPPGISGCGMTTLQRLTNTGDYLCRDPNSSHEASQSYYDNCFSSSSDGGGSSSSGDGGGGSSSSGDGGGSSSSVSPPYPEGCDECPWLDSILDTLTEQKHQIDELVFCLINPDICNSNTASDVVSSDSVNLDGVLERQDSVIRNLVKILGKMDSLNIFVDSAVFRDTALLRSVNSGFDGVDSGIIRINGSVITMDIELSRRLDSLISLIPPNIFDSIVKYQDSSIDRFDSILWGKGVGFSLVDSLTDSVVKYFKVSNHYDSIYNAQFKSFDSTFKYKMDNLSFGIDAFDYGPLGYGDTASTTLRRDIDGVRSAIASLDSSVSGGIGDIVGLLTAGVVDSSSVGYASGFVSEGENFADSLARAIGWKGGLDGVNVDSVFSHSTWETSGVDSVNDFVSDTLGGILDSLHLQLKSENDSIISSLPDSLTVWADSLIKVSPFVSFDSLIYSTLGAKIPNSDQCPEGCQSWSLTLPRFGLVNYTVDFGLCLGRVPLGGLNVLSFLRLLIRLVIVWSCISIVMWNFSQRKM